MTQGLLKRLHKDHLAGVLMVLVGLAAIYFSRTLQVGTLKQMGPGYFPIAIGAILALLGVAIAATAGKGESDSVVMDVPGESVDVLAMAHAAAHKGPSKPEWRGWSCILGGFIAFIVLFSYAGMVPAVTGITMISAFGERGNTLKSALWLAVIMNIIVVVVFWWALKMPFRLFWWDY